MHPIIPEETADVSSTSSKIKMASKGTPASSNQHLGGEDLMSTDAMGHHQPPYGVGSNGPSATMKEYNGGSSGKNNLHESERTNSTSKSQKRSLELNNNRRGTK